MGEEKQREKIETLEEFFRDLTMKIQHDSKANLAVGTMLTDLVDELGQLIKGLNSRAGILAKDALRLVNEMDLAVCNRDHERWDEVTKDTYILQGRIQAYMEVAVELAELGNKVGRRSIETKH